MEIPVNPILQQGSIDDYDAWTNTQDPNDPKSLEQLSYELVGQIGNGLRDFGDANIGYTGISGGVAYLQDLNNAPAVFVRNTGSWLTEWSRENLQKLDANEK